MSTDPPTKGNAISSWHSLLKFEINGNIITDAAAAQVYQYLICHSFQFAAESKVRLISETKEKKITTFGLLIFSKFYMHISLNKVLFNVPCIYCR